MSHRQPSIGQVGNIDDETGIAARRHIDRRAYGRHVDGVLQLGAIAGGTLHVDRSSRSPLMPPVAVRLPFEVHGGRC